MAIDTSRDDHKTGTTNDRDQLSTIRSGRSVIRPSTPAATSLAASSRLLAVHGMTMSPTGCRTTAR